jgi:hypothetical protein
LPKVFLGLGLIPTSGANMIHFESLYRLAENLKVYEVRTVTATGSSNEAVAIRLSVTEMYQAK